MREEVCCIAFSPIQTAKSIAAIKTVAAASDRVAWIHISYVGNLSNGSSGFSLMVFVRGQSAKDLTTHPVLVERTVSRSLTLYETATA